MDDAPRWSAKTAVKKDDQFTAAPDFIDEYDSDHLPLWGRIQASWHGMSGARRMVVFASLALLATWGGTSAIYFLDDLDGVAGSQEPGSGLAAQDGEDPSLPSVPRPEAPPEVGPDPASPAAGLNSTAPALPSLPSAP